MNVECPDYLSISDATSFITEQNDPKFFGTLIKLAPTIWATVSQAQIVYSLYQLFADSSKNGNRDQIYSNLLTFVKEKIPKEYYNKIILVIETTVTVIEYADKLKTILKEILEIEHQKSFNDDLLFEIFNEIIFA